MDGAIESRGSLDWDKDLGDARLREKIVTDASDRVTVVVDETKVATRLGGNTSLSAEIVSFRWQTVLDRLVAIGGFQLRWTGHLGDDASDHANAKRRWQELGSPEYLDAGAVAELNAVSGCEPEPYPFDFLNNAIGLHVTLPPLAVAAVTLWFAALDRG